LPNVSSKKLKETKRLTAQTYKKGVCIHKPWSKLEFGFSVGFFTYCSSTVPSSYINFDILNTLKVFLIYRSSTVPSSYINFDILNTLKVFLIYRIHCNLEAQQKESTKRPVKNLDSQKW